jgi:chaperonin GroEL (HSP60 family)
MASKQIAFDVNAREELRRGVDKLANAVKVTIGRAAATSSSTRNSALPPSPTMG